MKHTRSLSKLILLFCALLILVPALFSATYYAQSVSRQMDARARESIRFYFDQLNDRTALALNAVRASAYGLIASDALQEVMSSDTPPSQLTQRDIEQDIGLIMMNNAAWNQHGIRGVYLFRDDVCYVSIYRSGYPGVNRLRLSTVNLETRGINALGQMTAVDQFPQYVYVECVVLMSKIKE